MAAKKNYEDKYKDKRTEKHKEKNIEKQTDMHIKHINKKHKKNSTSKNYQLANEKKSAKSTIGKKQTWRAGNMLYPVPAVMVSLAREGEKPNIITVAWAGTVNSDPVMLSISVRKERYSHAILNETGEFVVNLVNEPLVHACDYCGVRSGRDVDKFSQMKLTPVAVEGVAAPAIAESPVNLACRVKQVIPLGSHDMFLAEVVSVTVDERYMDEKGTFHLNDAGLVAYSHGTYFKLGKALGTFGFSVRKR